MVLRSRGEWAVSSYFTPRGFSSIFWVVQITQYDRTENLLCIYTLFRIAIHEPNKKKKLIQATLFKILWTDTEIYWRRNQRKHHSFETPASDGGEESSTIFFVFKLMWVFPLFLMMLQFKGQSDNRPSFAKIFLMMCHLRPCTSHPEFRNIIYLNELAASWN